MIKVGQIRLTKASKAILQTIMSPQSYAAALEEAKKELAQAIAELGEAEQKVQDFGIRISDLRQTVTVLSKLCGVENVEIEEALGLTAAIRTTFTDAPLKSFTVQDMRLSLEAKGFQTRRYGNLLASIHTVINRLKEKHEIEESGINEAGKPRYTKTMPMATDITTFKNR